MTTANLVLTIREDQPGMVEIFDGDEFIARVTDSPRRRALAHTLAAAPQLLAALEDLVDLADPENAASDDEHAILDAAHAAIDAAKGGA